MPDQQAMIFDPLKAGLFDRYITGDMWIDHARWLRAVAEHSVIGECRACGAHLRPVGPPEDHGGITWYEAMCTSCQKVYAAPATISKRQDGGRVMRVSSRRSEMPSGWWNRRARALRDQNAAGTEGEE